MTVRPNGIHHAEPAPAGVFQFWEMTLNWQQQAFRAGLVSTEMMRVGLHHMQRNLDYFSMLGHGVDALGKANSDFLQRVSAESAADWSKTAEMAATWSQDPAQAAEHLRRH